MVLIGSAGVGWYMAGMYGTRIRILRELSHSLQVLYGEIEYAATDITESMGLLGRRGEYLKKFFDDIADQLKQGNGQSLYAIWSQELEKLCHNREYRILLQKEDVRFIKEIGKNLGNVDRMTQLHTLNLFQKQLDGMIGQAEEKYQGQAKICRVLGIVCGVFTAVLLF